MAEVVHKDVIMGLSPVASLVTWSVPLLSISALD